MAKVGRPTDYRPEFCDRVIQEGIAGGWMVQYAEACGVTRRTIINWAKVHPEFAEALEIAKQKAQDWLERAGMKGIMGEKINDRMWKIYAVHRHPDDYPPETKIKQEISGPEGAPLQTVVILPPKKDDEND